jgi:hypothetical protein
VVLDAPLAPYEAQSSPGVLAFCPLKPGRGHLPVSPDTPGSGGVGVTHWVGSSPPATARSGKPTSTATPR